MARRARHVLTRQAISRLLAFSFSSTISEQKERLFVVYSRPGSEGLPWSRGGFSFHLSNEIKKPFGSRVPMVFFPEYAFFLPLRTNIFQFTN